MSDTTEYLFIGGPVDGRRITISSDYTEFHIIHPGESRSEEHTYRKAWITGDAVHPMFVSEELSGSQAIWMLIEGYKKEGKKTRPKIHDYDYDTWLAEVARIAQDRFGWDDERAAASIDRAAWREYFDEGHTPAEAWREEGRSGL